MRISDWSSDVCSSDLDVATGGAGEASHAGRLHLGRHRLHGLEVAFGGDREAGLYDVDAHLLEDLGDLQLFLEVHGAARRLLAVAQRGVEDQHAATNCLGASSLGASSLGASSLGAGRLGAGRLGAGRSLPLNCPLARHCLRSEEHTSELQSLMRISSAVFCLKKKNKNHV